MRSWNWMLAAATAVALAPSASAQADARDELAAFVLRAAEQDFEVVRGEASLSGSAPLVGLKAEKAPAKQRVKRAAVKAAAKSKNDAKHVSALEATPWAAGRP
jgi:hypothetical protein